MSLRSFPASTLDGVASAALLVLHGIQDPLFRAQGVAVFVAALMGGGADDAADAPHSHATHVAELKRRLSSNIVPLEAIARGCCCYIGRASSSSRSSFLGSGPEGDDVL